MKFRIPILVTAVLLMASCYSDSDKLCPDGGEYNVTIDFRLPDKDGNCIFATEVSCVEMLLFDENGICRKIHTYDKAGLTSYQGAQLNLEPGTYHLVAWANTGTHTANNGVAELSKCEDAFISYCELTGGYAGDCDPVYFTPAGPYTRGIADSGAHVFSVGADGYNGTIDFAAAHRKVEIYVEGFNDGGDIVPVIELTGLGEGVGYYDGLPLKDQSGNIRKVDGRFTGQAVTDPSDGKRYSYTPFSAFWFEPSDDMIINIIVPSTGEVVYSIPLTDAIQQSGGNTGEIVISLLFSFRSTGVVITMPGWNSGDLEIGFD